MARLIDEALPIAANGWLSDPGDHLRGVLVALMEAGMLVRPQPPAPAPLRKVSLVREHPKPVRPERQLGAVVPRLALPRGES